jgi:protoheme IX farnesyltransferase
MNTRADVAAAPRELSGALTAVFELTKPGVTRLVMATTLCGAIIAPGPLAYGAFVWALVGTVLVVGAANALNMFLEADVDALMSRTRGRPIPSGRLPRETALWFGLLLAAVGLPVLALQVNPLTALIGAVALVSYVCAYTPLKRISPFAVWVGAFPGAAPPLMGWTAMTGSLDAAGLSLFTLLFVWQVPHFHAIAIFRQSEYERAGLKVLPSVRGLDYTKLSIVVLLILQLGLSALPAFLGIGRIVYALVATLLGAVYVGWGLAGLSESAGPRWARTLFFVSMPYLLGVFAALVADSL